MHQASLYIFGLCLDNVNYRLYNERSRGNRNIQEQRDKCEKDRSRENYGDRRDCRIDENRRRNDFDNREESDCPCKREYDYFQAEVREQEEKEENN